MATNQTFTTTYDEALRAFGKVQDGSAFGKWIVAELNGEGFWSGADYDFFFAFRSLVQVIRAKRAEGKGLKAGTRLVFSVNDEGRGVISVQKPEEV